MWRLIWSLFFFIVYLFVEINTIGQIYFAQILLTLLYTEYVHVS